MTPQLGLYQNLHDCNQRKSHFRQQKQMVR